VKAHHALTRWLVLAAIWSAGAGCAHRSPGERLFERRIATFQDFARSLPPCGSADAARAAEIGSLPSGQRRITVAGRLTPTCLSVVVEDLAILRSRQGPPPRCGICPAAAWALTAPPAPDKPVIVLGPRPSSLLTCDAEALDAAAPGLTVIVTGTLTPGEADPWLQLEMESICRNHRSRPAPR
jgi:hypothetical protein